MTAYRSLYQILGVGALATPEEIEAAYAARMSADESGATPLDPAERSLLKSAREVLSDPARRKQYDEQMAERLRNALSSGGGTVREGSSALRRTPADRTPSNRPDWLTFPRFAFLLVTLLVGVGIYLHFAERAERLRVEHARQVEEARARKHQAERLEQERREAAELARVQREEQRVRMQLQDRGEARLDSVFEQHNANTGRVIGVIEREQESRAGYRANAEQRRAEQHRLQLERQEDYARERDRIRAEQQVERDRQYLRELERTRSWNLGK